MCLTKKWTLNAEKETERQRERERERERQTERGRIREGRRERFRKVFATFVVRDEKQRDRED